MMFVFATMNISLQPLDETQCNLTEDLPQHWAVLHTNSRHFIHRGIQTSV